MPWEKQFDVNQALCAAKDAFWEQGYEATSMSQLLERMGINRGSFYDTFNSKRDVLIQALNQYTEQRGAQLAEYAQAHSGLECINAIFECALKESRSKTASNGCFTVNCALELAPRDDEIAEIVQQSMMSMQLFIRDQIARAIEEGDARKNLDPAAAAKTITALMLGIRVLARAGAPRSCLQSIPEQAIEMLT